MGWIKLDRQIMDNWIYSAEPFDKCHAWIDLLLLATHEDETFVNSHGIVTDLKRGQLVTSIEILSKRWKWSRNKVNHYLRVLEVHQMIHREGTPNGTTLTLVNYSKFQDGRYTKGITEGVTEGTPEGVAEGLLSRSKRNKEYKKATTNFEEMANNWLKRGGENGITDTEGMG